MTNYPTRTGIIAYFATKEEASAYQSRIEKKRDWPAEIVFDSSIKLFKLTANPKPVPPAVYTPKRSRRTTSKAAVTKVSAGKRRIANSYVGPVIHYGTKTPSISLPDIPICSTCGRVGPLQNQRCSICLSKP